ncbi:hypothetical protein CBR_g37965 [Chara braunii]|uniref:Uncharacterized protein n=1 Tax=Chara braunii TaxID=69332 RepID=A0A388LP20_CHABU|nr:hypothetical protein CBR_g37965 [Chara braunii]|eukprot:GBG84090.1 hypothetical protein CBR_g37965 [Chara braunii]
MHVGSLEERIQHRLKKVVLDASKGKAKMNPQEESNYSSGDASCESEGNDVKVLRGKTQKLTNNDKRKRSTEKAVSDSPPMETPTKKINKHVGMEPRRLTKRLQLTCRHPPMKRSPKQKTPRSATLKKKKIPASMGALGKLKYVTDNLRDLADLNVDDLKKICKEEDVQYGGKKMQTILAITEKRTNEAYESDEIEEPENDEEDRGARDEKNIGEEVVEGDVFLRSLGGMRQMVFGLRRMDDVSMIVLDKKDPFPADMTGLEERIQHRLKKVVLDASKDKAKMDPQEESNYSSGDASCEYEGSDVEVLRGKTQKQTINEKRKRSTEKAVGDSPPMDTPTKKINKHAGMEPRRLTERLQLTCRHPPMKRSPKQKTPRSATLKKKKIPASMGALGKLKYVTGDLADFNVDDLKKICKEEDVQYGGKKMQTILAITEKRTKEAYESDEIEEPENDEEDRGARDEKNIGEEVVEGDV